MSFKTLISSFMIATLAMSPAYAKKDKDKQIPPGLQKKAERGQPLPPGWQKKLRKGEVMDRAVYNRADLVVPIDDKGILTVSIEGRVVRLYHATREIIEILK